MSQDVTIGFCDGGHRAPPGGGTSIGSAAWFVDVHRYGAVAQPEESSSQAELRSLRDLLRAVTGDLICIVDQKGWAGDGTELLAGIQEKPGKPHNAARATLVAEVKDLLSGRAVEIRWVQGHGTLAPVGFNFVDHLERYARQMAVLTDQGSYSVTPAEFSLGALKRVSPLGALMSKMLQKQAELGIGVDECILGHSEGNKLLREHESKTT